MVEEDEEQMNEVFATDESPRGVNSCMDEKMRVCEEPLSHSMLFLWIGEELIREKTSAKGAHFRF